MAYLGFCAFLDFSYEDICYFTVFGSKPGQWGAIDNLTHLGLSLTMCKGNVIANGDRLESLEVEEWNVKCEPKDSLIY